jgi:hypothetical protein
MAYNIKRINKNTPLEGVFFFDTMVWLSILAPEFNKSNNRSDKYISFFDAVFNAPKAKIALSSLSVSEITNTYFRTVAVRMFEKETGTQVPHNEYKTKYRITDHFKNQYQIINDELLSRADSILYFEHDLTEEDFAESLKYPRLDFNDYCYFKMCYNYDINIVTDDSDFLVKGVPILTLNGRLIGEKDEILTKHLRPK